MIVRAYNHKAPLDLQISSLEAQIADAYYRLVQLRACHCPQVIINVYARTVWRRMYRLGRLRRKVERN